MEMTLSLEKKTYKLIKDENVVRIFIDNGKSKDIYSKYIDVNTLKSTYEVAMDLIKIHQQGKSVHSILDEYKAKEDD